MRQMIVPILKKQFNPIIAMLFPGIEVNRIEWSTPSNHECDSLHLPFYIASVVCYLSTIPKPLEQINFSTQIAWDMGPEEIPCWIVIQQGLLMLAEMPYPKRVVANSNENSTFSKLDRCRAPSPTWPYVKEPKVKEMTPDDIWGIFLRKIPAEWDGASSVESKVGGVKSKPCFELAKRDCYKLLSIFTENGFPWVDLDGNWLLGLEITKDNKDEIGKFLLTLDNGYWHKLGNAINGVSDPTGLSLVWKTHDDIRLSYYNRRMNEFDKYLTPKQGN